MKILGITTLMLGLLLSFSICVDVALGFTLNESFKRQFNSFQVMGIPEFITFLFFLFLNPLLALSRERKNK